MRNKCFWLASVWNMSSCKPSPRAKFIDSRRNKNKHSLRWGTSVHGPWVLLSLKENNDTYACAQGLSSTAWGQLKLRAQPRVLGCRVPEVHGVGRSQGAQAGSGELGRSLCTFLPELVQFWSWRLLSWLCSEGQSGLGRCLLGCSLALW